MSDVWLDDLLDATAAIKGIEARLAHLRDGPVRITECLRARDGVAVYAADLAGRRVVVKRGGPDAQAVRTEIARVRPQMNDGPNRVVDCIAAIEDLLVIDHAPGRLLQDVLDDMGRGAARDAVLAQCGTWAALYAGPQLENGAFGPRFWLRRRIATIALAPVAPPLVDPLAALMAWLEQWAGRIGNAPVTKGWVHGDMTPMNMTLDQATAGEDVLWGFDLSGRTGLPLARDIARFMVTWGRSSDGADSRMQRELAALAGPVLMPQERQTILPFFLGDQIAGRLAAQAEGDARAARLERMATDLMETYP